jgi:hypothetical protein
MPQKFFLLILLVFLVSSAKAQQEVYIESTVNPSFFWMVDKERDGAVYLKDPSSTSEVSSFQFLKQLNVSRRQAPGIIQFLLNILPPGFIISFESSSQANHYLRHFSGRLRLDPYAENTQFAGDASFKLRPALDASSEHVSFESVNMPRSFLKQDKDFGIILAPFDPFDPELDRAPYIFKIHSSLPANFSTSPIEPPASSAQAPISSTTP